jgi:glyoxylase I family protein
MINGLHHAAIATHDIDRIVEFYVSMMGFEIVSKGGWDVGDDDIDGMVGLQGSASKVAMLQAGNCFLEVFEYLSPRGRRRDPDYPVCDTGFTHIGLNVTDIEAEFERLSAAGMRFHGRPIDRPPGVLRAAYGRDPDGNVIELVEVMTPDHPFVLAMAPRPRFVPAP